MRSPVLIAAFLFLAATPAFTQQEGEPFRIFFDWGKPELTRDARSTLDEVATAYQERKPNGIEIAGHADRSGSAAVNRAASRRRAEAARAYLAAKGIPIDAMAISGLGESRSIVPTEDGVREAQNRRVEIRFR
jgi:OmpA-OmpF porin, OOP family